MASDWTGPSWDIGPDFPSHPRGDHRPQTHGAAPLPPGQWSRRYSACTACGRTDHPHASRGICFGCRGRRSVS